MDTIIAYTLENWPILGLFLIILTGVCFISVKITTLVNRSNAFYEKVNELPCEERRFVNESNHNTLKDKFSNISEEITAIRVFLQVKHETVDLFSAKHSPRVLNNFGEKIFSEIKGNDFLEKNKELLFSLIHEQSPKTALDVEYYANYILIRLVNEEIFNWFKDFVYLSNTIDIVKENKTTQHNLSLTDICFILSIPLRDLYLAEYPEIIPEQLETISK
jgi:hypothetical protein